MAQAAAAGRLEEFLQHEIPAGDHARNLAMMMMGMSGMMPGDLPAAPPSAPAAETGPQPEGIGDAASAQPPPEVLRAVGAGDVAGLMGLLRAEHAKRNPECAAAEAPAPHGPAPGAPAAPGAARPGIDAALVDELIRIAAGNDVSVDWLMLRAVKLYVEDFRRTGRL
jgi:hypothetical protein